MIKLGKPIKKKPFNGIMKVQLNGEVNPKEWIRESFGGEEYKKEMLVSDGKKNYRCFGVYPCDVRDYKREETMFMYDYYRETERYNEWVWEVNDEIIREYDKGIKELNKLLLERIREDIIQQFSSNL